MLRPAPDRTLALLLALACAACATDAARAPLPRPAVEIDVRHFAGSPRAVHEPPSEVPVDDCLRAEFRLHLCEHAPTDVLPEVSTRAALVLDSRGGESFGAVAELAVGSRAAQGPAALELARALRDGAHGRVLDLGRLHGGLPPGVTAVARVRSMLPLTVGGYSTMRPCFEVLAARPADAAEPVRLALRFDDVVARARVVAEADVDERVRCTQTVILEDALVPDGQPIVLLVPARFDEAAGRTYLVEVAIARAAADDGAVRRCVADLEEARTRTVPPGSSLAGAIDAARRALARDPLDRRALLFLAEAAGATWSIDCALLAAEATLARWSASLLEAELPATDHATLSWALDRRAIEALAAAVESGEAPLEVRAAVLQRAGEAGRFPGSLANALLAGETRAEFDAALVAENLDLLLLDEPGACIRACDWLRSRGVLPDDFDPLASRDARLEALRRAGLAETGGGAAEETVR